MAYVETGRMQHHIYVRMTLACITKVKVKKTDDGAVNVFEDTLIF